MKFLVLFFLISGCSHGTHFKNLRCMDQYLYLREIIQNKDYKAFDTLLDQGLSIDSKVFKCSRTVIMVIDSGDVEFLEYFITKNPDLNVTNCQGQTALYFANAEKAKFLINAGANVNIKDWINKNTPLHEALKIGPVMTKIDTDYINVLINSGADLHAVNKFGQTPLQYFKARLNTFKNKIAPYKELSSPKAHQLDLIKAYNKLKSQEEILTSILS